MGHQYLLSANQKLCSVFILAFIIIYISVPGKKKLNVNDFENMNSGSPFDSFLCPIERSIAGRLRSCLSITIRRNLAQSPDSVWDRLSEIMSSCKVESVAGFLRARLVSNKDETKILIPTRSAKSANESCTHVTLGVGGDIEAEKTLLKMYPQCELYGADPSKQSGSIFKNVGKYHEVAVGGSTANQTNLVLNNGGYFFRKVPTLSLIDFLKSPSVNKKFIDFLWMDTEGAEFKSMNLFLKSKGPTKGPKMNINDANITICQMNVEFHDGLERFDMTKPKFGDMVLSLVTESDFLPIFAAGGATRRLFLINANSTECLTKYFATIC